MTMQPTRHHLKQTLNIYAYPSTALWRCFELAALQQVEMPRPILEIGCADGSFTKEAVGMVDVGIDLSPRAIRRAQTSSIFRTVRLQDARALGNSPSFNTVLANSVLEHIPDVESVLQGCFRSLWPGGVLVATIPLININDNMLFGNTWKKLRQRRLAHVNLWPVEQWLDTLCKVGFTIRSVDRFFGPDQVRVWDALDIPTVVGTARVNLGSVSKKISMILPKFVKHYICSFWIAVLSRELNDSGNGNNALIVARKP